MKQYEYKLLKERYEQKEYYERIAHTVIQYLLTIFGIITIILFIILARQLKKRMQFENELQRKLVELKRSHEELAQITHALSHDIQEPLRKIQIFSNRLLYVKNNVDEDSLEALKRIDNAAKRTQELIADMQILTGLNNEEIKSNVDLNNVLQNALKELEEKIKAKNAQISIDHLPEIFGDYRQLQLLFKSLLDNSLKFSKAGIDPVITIKYENVQGEELHNIDPSLKENEFYRITVSDNGIGFDNKFTGKIFQIFQRLHHQQSEYPGKGIGLSICQRIMVNHNGYIFAYGKDGSGASFKLYFPAKE